MTDDESAPSITEFAHKRGADGELLPVDKTVEVRGEGEATIEVIPATSGQRTEWKQRLENSDDELSDEVQEELFDEFLTYDPADFGNAESWSDIRPALADAIATAIFSEIFDVETDDMDRALTQAMEDVTEGNRTQD